MAGHLLFALSLLLAGLAAAGLVGGPSLARRRLDRRRLDPPDPGAPESWLRGTGWTQTLGPRPGAPPRRQRYAMGAVAGIVASLGWQLLAPDAGLITWSAAPPVAAGMIIVLGRVESPAARNRTLRMTVDLPQLLELLAAAMQAGLPLRGAVREVITVSSGPLCDDLRGVLRSIDLGAPDAAAWRGLRDHPVLGRISVDLARSVDSGTMVVATLRHHAQLARRDRHGALEARAKTVGVRSVPPLMICFVPAFLLICVVPIVVTAIGQAIG